MSCKISDYLEAAILCATKDALNSKKPNPIILLSPACASFDQFKDFEARGDVFRSKSGEIIALFKREKNAAKDEGNKKSGGAAA